MIIYILTSVCGIVGSVCNTIERYRKDPEDKTKWVVDEAAALVVKHIFKLCMDCLLYTSGIRRVVAMLDTSLKSKTACRSRPFEMC